MTISHRFLAAVAAMILVAPPADAAPERREAAHFSAPHGGIERGVRAARPDFGRHFGPTDAFRGGATHYAGARDPYARAGLTHGAGRVGARDRFAAGYNGRGAWNWRSAWGYGGAGWGGGWGGYWDPGWGLDAGWAWGGIGLGLGIGLIVAPPLFVLPPPIYAAPPPILLGMPAIAPPALGAYAPAPMQAASLPPPAQVLPQAPAALVGAAVPPPIVMMPPPPVMVAAMAPPLIFAPPEFAFGIAPPFLAFSPIAPIFWAGGFITGGYIADAFYGGFWDPGFRVGYGGGFAGAYGWHGADHAGIGARGAVIHNVGYRGGFRADGFRGRGFGRGPVGGFGEHAWHAAGRPAFAPGHAFGGHAFGGHGSDGRGRHF